MNIGVIGQGFDWGLFSLGIIGRSYFPRGYWRGLLPSGYWPDTSWDIEAAYFYFRLQNLSRKSICL